MTPLQYLFCALLSAVTLTLGIPNELLPNGSALLGLVALVPLYRCLLTSKTWRSAGFAGGLTMGLVHLLSSFWLAFFKEFAIFTLGGSTLLNVVYGVVAGWVFLWALRRPKWARPFLFAAAWTLWEWFKSTGFLAYPWGTLVMTSRSLRALIQIADITGAWGISFLIALFNAVLAEVTLLHPAKARDYLRTERPVRRLAGLTGTRTLAFTLLIAALALAYGTYRLGHRPEPETALSVSMIQHNADPWDTDEETCVRESERLTREALAARGDKPDLVVWSESTLPWPWAQYRSHYSRYPVSDPMVPFLAEIGTPLVTGAPVLVDPERKGYSNSVVYLSPEGSVLDWYAKIQLVPFAEYMPLTDHPWVRRFFDTLVGFSSGWVPGKEFKSFSVTNDAGTDIRFSTPICFEDAFAPVVADLHATGSDLLVNLTNDSWSETESAEMQHFTVASFRAIELRTTLVRSTNAGYSCVIDPTGRVLADLPLFESAYLNVDVPIYPRTITFYARFRDWFPGILALCILLAVGISAARRAREWYHDRRPLAFRGPEGQPLTETRFHWGNGGEDERFNEEEGYGKIEELPAVDSDEEAEPLPATDVTSLPPSRE